MFNYDILIRSLREANVRHYFLVLVLLFANCALAGVLLFSSGHPSGFDGYYYALQVSSVLDSGTGLNNDPSIVFHILGAFHFFIPDPIAAVKIAMLLFSLLTVCGMYFLAFEITGQKTAAFFAAFLYLLLLPHHLFTFEYLKNGIANCFLVWLVFLVLDEHPGKKKIPVIVVFMALALLTHKLTGVIGLVFVLWRLVLPGIKYLRRHERLQPWLYPAIGTAVVLFLVSGLLISVVRKNDLAHFFSDISPAALVERIPAITTSFMPVHIRIELVLYQFLPLFAAGFLAKPYRRRVFPFAAVSLLLAMPFITFSFDGIAYRLLLAAGLFMPLMLSVCLSSIRTPVARNVLMFVLAALAVFVLPARVEGYLANHYLDYDEYIPVAQKIKENVDHDQVLIAHRGLSFFLWYKTGIKTFHFMPSGNRHRFYRVTYGLGLHHFKAISMEDAPGPRLHLSGPYYLVPEAAFFAFYKNRKNDLKLLESWRNPTLTRPGFMYTFTEGEDDISLEY